MITLGQYGPEKTPYLDPFHAVQTRNYDAKSSNHHPSLLTLGSNGLSFSKMKW